MVVALAVVLATVGVVATVATTGVLGFLPAQNPRWPASYAAADSLLAMSINMTGLADPWFTKQFGGGVFSIDWSTNKAAWAAAHPMDSAAAQLELARRCHEAAPEQKVFVYRNLVKALPWFASVREKLEDPQYAGFFLRFRPNQQAPPLHVPRCDPVTKLCSDFYHDQEQTPQVPSPSNPHPDGVCPPSGCDCGPVIPCGEYLFDHRNGTMLTDWLVKEYIFGKEALQNDWVHGLFIDDFWCSSIINGTHACGDPVQGPSEINKYNQQDMGLTDQDIRDITLGWLHNMKVVQQAIVDAKKYTWSLIPDQTNANAYPVILEPGPKCTTWMREVACRSDSPYRAAPLLMGLTTPAKPTEPFPYAAAQVHAFLLARGDYAWLGWGHWGMIWPENYPIPAPALKDYGTPVDPFCHETITPGVFSRKWRDAAGATRTLTLDCNSFETTTTTI